jgi:predicted ATPase with chaperone activity
VILPEDGVIGQRISNAGAVLDQGRSAREHETVLRVARTIADPERHHDIKPQDIAEADGYRSLEHSASA